MLEVIDEKKAYNFLKSTFSNISLNDPFEKFAGFFINNILVGVIAYSVIYERAEINYILVDENYRHKGIAQELLNFVFKEIDNNCDNISLEVNVNNNPAVNLYLKCGFKIVTVRKNYYGSSDGYLMIKEMK